MVDYVRPAIQNYPFENEPSTDTPVWAEWYNAVDEVVSDLGGPLGRVKILETGGAATNAALRLLRIALATRDAGPRPVVYVGSSTTAGNNATTADRRYVNLLTAALQAAFPLRTGTTSPAMRTLAQAVAATLTAGVQGVNAGVGGTTAANYLTATTRGQIAGLDPVAVVHMIGSNDYASGVAPATYKANVQTHIADLDSQIGNLHVHVLVHTYNREDVTSPAYAWSAYRDALQQLAAEDPARRVFIDLDPIYATAGVPGGDSFGLIDTDQIHQTDSGHAVMAEVIRDALGIRVVPTAATAPGDTTAPSTPTGLTATPGDGQVALTWNAATDNVAVTGYRVYRNGSSIGTPTGTSFTDTGRTNGTSYAYTVSAVDAALNESPQSAAVNATPVASGDTTDPSTPTGLTATPGNAQVALTWNAATDNVAVTGYRVYRNGALIASPTVTNHTDPGRANGTEYSYQVSAVDAALNESPLSAAVTATPTAPGGTPTLSDSFTRADSTTTLGNAETGQTWAAISGTWGIISNKAYVVTPTTGSQTALIETGLAHTATHDVEGKILYGAGGSLPGLAFRSLDQNNRIGVFLDQPNQTVELWRGMGAASTEIAGTGVAQSIVSGTEYTIRVVSTPAGLVTVYVDGVEKIVYTLPSAELAHFVASGYTKAGFRGSTHHRFDDLSAREA